jgi:hypothetical protein
MPGRARRQAVDRAPDRGAPAWWGGRDRGGPRLSRRDDRFSRPLLFRQRTMGRNQYGDVARRGRSLAAFGAGHRQLCRHLLPQRVGARPGRCSGPVGHQLRPGLAPPVDPAFRRSFGRRRNLPDRCRGPIAGDRRQDHADRRYRGAIYGPLEIHATGMERRRGATRHTRRSGSAIASM